ncbi:adenine deaminase [Inquilinus ginsengisoli]|uniref:hypothetical protein n=1 Tax=Inquilinus ginsengisoli TaxID=363840 RepID=UPI003D240A8A
MATSLPDDLLIGAEDEVAIRQDLVLVALGKRPADTLLRVDRLLDVHTRSWRDDQEIAIKGRRIAWTGPAGTYPGIAARRVEKPGLAAVPGFGEVHKHIESTHLTPEWEAALVLPRGNTWTCEASHEFSNVDGPNNLAFWFEARRRGSPLKIFPLPGSAVPPTAYEWGGGWYGYDEQKGFLKQSLMVAGLDEVMDWPAVWNPENPSYPRLWGRSAPPSSSAAWSRAMAPACATPPRSAPSPPPAWPPTTRRGRRRKCGRSWPTASSSSCGPIRCRR